MEIRAYLKEASFGDLEHRLYINGIQVHLDLGRHYVVISGPDHHVPRVLREHITHATCMAKVEVPSFVPRRAFYDGNNWNAEVMKDGDRLILEFYGVTVRKLLYGWGYVLSGEYDKHAEIAGIDQELAEKKRQLADVCREIKMADELLEAVRANLVDAKVVGSSTGKVDRIPLTDEQKAKLGRLRTVLENRDSDIIESIRHLMMNVCDCGSFPTGSLLKDLCLLVDENL
ncbi:MAG: hypothetical protein ABIA47_02645 [bacterium]